jgi:hypothetical protein
MATSIAARHRLGRIRAMIAHSRTKRAHTLATHDMAIAIERWEDEGGASARAPMEDRIWARAIHRVLDRIGQPLRFQYVPPAPHYSNV